MMILYSKEYKDLTYKLKPWFDDDNRDAEGCPSLKPDTPEELKALYPRYYKLNKEMYKLDWPNKITTK